MKLPHSAPVGFGFLLLVVTSAPRASLGDVYEDLMSDDVRVIRLAAEKAAEIPTPETVRKLMAVVLSKNPHFRTAQTFGHQVVREPCTYALIALSRIVPNPPTTFTSGFTLKKGPGPYVHYLEVWESWWEESGIRYGDDATELPPRSDQSLLNLDSEGREAVEQRAYERSIQLMVRLTSNHAAKPKSTFDEIVEEYLGERRSIRAAARVTAATPVAVVNDPVRAVPDVTPADKSAAAIRSEISRHWHWVALVGLIAVSAISVFLFLRRGQNHRRARGDRLPPTQ